MVAMGMFQEPTFYMSYSVLHRKLLCVEWSEPQYHIHTYSYIYEYTGTIPS